MFDRREINRLSAAAASAVVFGALAGVWVRPPSYLAQPVVRQEPQPVFAEDPNLARYRQVVAEQGGARPVFIVQANYPAEPAPGPQGRAENRGLDAEIAREEAAFQAQSERWETERLAWLDTPRHDWPVRRAYSPPGDVQTVDIHLDAPQFSPTEHATATALDETLTEHNGGPTYREPRSRFSGVTSPGDRTARSDQADDHGDPEGDDQP